MKLIEYLKNFSSEIEFNFLTCLKAAGITVLGFSVVYCG
jgi:hypothetical protein